MIDPVSQFIARQAGLIAANLAKGAQEDYVKDFFKDRIKDLETLAQKPFAQNAVKESLTAFAGLFLQQLAELRLKEKELKPFVKPLKQFVKEPTVQQVLGTVFATKWQQVDAAKFSQCWQTTRYGGKAKWWLTEKPQSWIEKNPDKYYGKLLPAVPAGFDWLKLGEAYRQAVQEYLKTEVFGKHWRDESWHPVLRSIAGMLDEQLAGEIIEFLMEQKGERENFVNVFLAAECLDEVKNRNVIAQIDRCLQERVQSLIGYGLILPRYSNYIQQENDRIRKIRTKAVATFAEVWHDSPDTLPWLKNAASDEDSDVRLAAVEAILILSRFANVTGWKEEPDTLPLLKTATSDEHPDVRSAAVKAIVTGWKDRPETLKNWDVRSAAVQAILIQSRFAMVTGWKDDPETLPWLKTVTSDADWSVRSAAVEALATVGKDDPDTLPWLKNATSNEDWAVRRAAVEAIVTVGKDHPDTLPWLKNATSNKNWDVRSAAVEALAAGWKDHPDTLPWLKNATADENSDVRRAAVEAIVFGWKDHPDTLPWLKTATSDENSDVREAAVEAIATVGKDDPDTLPLLKRATADEDWDVREEAVEALASGWIREPGVFELLCKIAINDPFVRKYDVQNNPRQTALIALVKSYADRSEVLEILRDRSLNDSDENLRQFAQKKLAEWEGR